MMNITEENFRGFPPETFIFLQNLKENNSKVWFEAHRQEYKEHLIKPLQYLVEDLGPAMLEIDPLFEVTPEVNKTISRIYRDTRFSRDKSLYKDTMWITFKRPSKEWKSKPTYFFEISPQSYRYGMGYFSVDKETMDQFRKVIIQKPKEFLRAISFYPEQSNLVLEGEKYKKTLGDAIPSEFQDWYQRKNFYLVCNREMDYGVLCRALLDDMTDSFNLLAPLYHFLKNIS